MLYFDRQEIKNINDNDFYAFFINKNGYLYIITYIEQQYNIALSNDSKFLNLELMKIPPYLIYNKYIKPGINIKYDNSTINILGKEFQLTINKIIISTNLNSEFVIGLVLLKKNWTCYEIPFIVFAKNPNLQNYHILNILKNYNNYYIYDCHIKVESKLGLYSHVSNDCASNDNENLKESPLIAPKTPEERPTYFESPPKTPEEIPIIKKQPKKPKELPEEIEIKTNILKGPKGGNYIIVNNKKKYLGKKTKAKNLYVAKVTN